MTNLTLADDFQIAVTALLAAAIAAIGYTASWRFAKEYIREARDVYYFSTRRVRRGLAWNVLLLAIMIAVAAVANSSGAAPHTIGQVQIYGGILAFALFFLGVAYWLRRVVEGGIAAVCGAGLATGVVIAVLFTI